MGKQRLTTSVSAKITLHWHIIQHQKNRRTVYQITWEKFLCESDKLPPCPELTFQLNCALQKIQELKILLKFPGEQLKHLIWPQFFPSDFRHWTKVSKSEHRDWQGSFCTQWREAPSKYPGILTRLPQLSRVTELSPLTHMLKIHSLNMEACMFAID